MTHWARLTWQAAVPAAHARDLVRRLGVSAVKGGSVRGARVLRLGETELEIRPWQREGPTDDPRPWGRLMFEPGGGSEPDGEPDTTMALVAIAWSTVELDRAEGELDPWLEPVEPLKAGAGRVEGIEPLLGARTRLRRAQGLPGGHIVFAEPTTEGRLAASLARDGEGPCALYVRPAAGLDAWLRTAPPGRARTWRVETGPAGRSVLLPAGPPAGPFVIVADGPVAVSVRGPAGTIGA